jgi:peptide deformylase
MAVLPILIAPDPRLKAKAKPVETVDDDLRRFMDDMLETMYANDGFGLAATQVGVAKRVIVIDLNLDEGAIKDPALIFKIVNPELLSASPETSVLDEACLSVPAQHGKVTRPAKVRFSYLDENNVSHDREVDGLFAACIQHEIDHLDGVLFIDRLSPLKRELILHKLAKMKKRP